MIIGTPRKVIGQQEKRVGASETDRYETGAPGGHRTRTYRPHGLRALRAPWRARSRRRRDRRALRRGEDDAVPSLPLERRAGTRISAPARRTLDPGVAAGRGRTARASAGGA